MGLLGPLVEAKHSDESVWGACGSWTTGLVQLISILLNVEAPSTVGKLPKLLSIPKL